MMDYAIRHKQVSSPEFVIFLTLASEMNNTPILPCHQNFFPYISCSVFFIPVPTVQLQPENASQE